MQTIWSQINGSAKYANRAEALTPGLRWTGSRLQNGEGGVLVMGVILPNSPQVDDLAALVDMVYDTLTSEFRGPLRVGLTDFGTTWVRDDSVAHACLYER